VKLVWDESAWADYVWWQAQDRKILKRINALVTDIARNGNEGIGKPEPLKHGFQGYWSRRITDEHRLVYKIAEDEIRIAACRYHYERLPTAPALSLCPGRACGAQAHRAAVRRSSSTNGGVSASGAGMQRSTGAAS
jgi:toxin YoeB